MGIYQYIPNKISMFIVQVCEALKKANIPFAIVGGYAVSLHGVPRGTFDVDMVIQWTLENLKKVESSLKELGLTSRLPINAEAVFHFKDEYIKNRNLIAWNFYDPRKPINQVDLILTYDLNPQNIKLAMGSLPILSKNSLIKMKKASGRPQDLEDIKFLEAL